MKTHPRFLAACLALFVLTALALSGCAAAKTGQSVMATPPAAVSPADNTCPVTEPEWAKPPEDSAVEGTPAFGNYFVNEDRSMWASSWWTGQDESYLRRGEAGIKVGWFRPAGATLAITGERLDAQASPLEAHVPCCYPTRFQATGLMFPTEGCWQVAAKAADSELSFVVWVEP